MTFFPGLPGHFPPGVFAGPHRMWHNQNRTHFDADCAGRGAREVTVVPVELGEKLCGNCRKAVTGESKKYFDIALNVADDVDTVEGIETGRYEAAAWYAELLGMQWNLTTGSHDFAPRPAPVHAWCVEHLLPRVNKALAGLTTDNPRYAPTVWEARVFVPRLGVWGAAIPTAAWRPEDYTALIPRYGDGVSRLAPDALVLSIRDMVVSHLESGVSISEARARAHDDLPSLLANVPTYTSISQVDLHIVPDPDSYVTVAEQVLAGWKATARTQAAALVDSLIDYVSAIEDEIATQPKQLIAAQPHHLPDTQAALVRRHTVAHSEELPGRGGEGSWVLATIPAHTLDLEEARSWQDHTVVPLGAVEPDDTLELFAEAVSLAKRTSLTRSEVLSIARAVRS